MAFPLKLLQIRAEIYKVNLIENLCQVAGVKKLGTSPYHLQANRQCEHFNSTLLNMLGTLTPEQKKDWMSHVAALVHAYNCTKNAVLGLAHTIFFLVGSLDSLWM